MTKRKPKQAISDGRSNWLIVLWLSGLVSVMAPGCGPGRISENHLRAAQAAFDEGLRSMESNDHAAAVESLTIAIDIGGLSPDQLADAHFRRAACYAELGEFDPALDDLEIAGAGYGDLAELHRLRAAILESMGKPSEAAEARRLADQYSPNSYTNSN